eukprot:g38683.t1
MVKEEKLIENHFSEDNIEASGYFSKEISFKLNVIGLSGKQESDNEVLVFLKRSSQSDSVSKIVTITFEGKLYHYRPISKWARTGLFPRVGEPKTRGHSLRNYLDVFNLFPMHISLDCEYSHRGIMHSIYSAELSFRGNGMGHTGKSLGSTSVSSVPYG